MRVTVQAVPAGNDFAIIDGTLFLSRDLPEHVLSSLRREAADIDCPEDYHGRVALIQRLRQECDLGRPKG